MSAIPKSSDNATSSSSASSNHHGRHQHLLRSKEKQTHESPFFSGNGKKGAFFQPRLSVSGIDDPSEREADKTAEEVTQTIHSGKGEGFFPPSPPAVDSNPSGLNKSSFFQRKPAFESPTEMDQNTAANRDIQRSSRETNRVESDNHQVSTDFETQLHTSKGGGKPLNGETRGKMESAFGTDFSSVRVHTDSGADTMNNQVAARAFTHGSDIYFKQGEYNPDQKEGSKLLAHELTHVVQQGGTSKSPVQRAAKPTISQHAPPMIQRGIVQKARDWAADKARYIPGYTMLTVILGFNPISGRDVPRNASNIFRAIMGFIPGGELIWQALNKYGIFEKVGAWLVKQIKKLANIGNSIVSAFKSFVNSVGILDLRSPGKLWRRAKSIFTTPIKQIISFLKGLVKDILNFIRQAILLPFAGLAAKTRAWPLLIAVLGKNPITGDKVPRTADTLIAGFMTLIGQEEIWENMKKANAVERGWKWFKTNLKQLFKLVKSLPSRFIRALKSLTIKDLILLPLAFAKIIGVFATFAFDFISWAGKAMWDLLLIIFEVVAPKAIPFLKKAGKAFKSILKNPIRFLGNLVKAGKMGFYMFMNKIGKILTEVLIDWLTGTLQGAGVYIPQAFNFKEIVRFILSVLGISWENIRAKLVKYLGEGPVKVLEGTFELVKILVKEGPAAAWEKIKEHLSNLKDTVIKEIISWVTTTVVTKAIVKIVSSLNPVGAFVQAILTIYGVIKVFIQRIQKIIEVGRAFLNSIIDIASGNLMPAAMKIVTTMKGILVMAVSFLAEFAGLGKISQALQKILMKIRGPIDKAIDKVVAWIAKKAKAFLKKGVAKVKDIFFPKKKFKVGDKTHTAEGIKSGNAYKILLHSEDKTVPEFIIYAQKQGYKPVKDINDLDSMHKKWVLMASTTEKDRTEKAKQYQSIIKKIEKIWTKIPDANNIKMSKINWTTGPEGRAEKVVADPLTAKGVKGSAPRETIPGYDPTLTHNGEQIACIKAHLLHHKMHGPGRKFNMTPTSRSMNGKMLHQVEKYILMELGIKPVKPNLQKTRVAHYETEIKYKSNPPKSSMKHVAWKVRMYARVRDITTNKKVTEKTMNNEPNY